MFFVLVFHNFISLHFSAKNGGLVIKPEDSQPRGYGFKIQTPSVKTFSNAQFIWIKSMEQKQL
jgi:hypothetical protein